MKKSKMLSHIRVLDLTRVLAGPWCTQNLADMGADVIKVERPGLGDDSRGWGPPFLRDQNGKDTEAAYYLCCNRGKRSMTLDISKPEGQEIVRKLAAHSDIVVENYKVGTLERYGLAYEHLRRVRPDIIYCSITGFGQSGPYADRPGYDFVFQGISGLMSITGERDSLPGGGPQKVGVAVTDIFTGMYSTVAILGALAYRNVSGEGQYIDMSLLDTSVAVLANQSMNYLTSGVVPERYGNAHANLVPYEVFPCAGGNVILAIGNDTQFAAFCELAGRPELATDERYRTNSARLVNRQSLIPEVQCIMKTREMHEWVKILEAANVPCGPINDLAQMFEDPQVRHRGIEVAIPHPLAGRVSMVASPMRFSATPVTYEVPPPLLGEHTREILGELAQVDADAYSRLANKGIV